MAKKKGKGPKSSRTGEKLDEKLKAASKPEAEGESEAEGEGEGEAEGESEAGGEPKPASAPTSKAHLAGASWALGLARFDGWWTRQEVRLVTVVLLSEIFALCVWIALKALSTEYDGQNLLGLIFRAVVFAVVIGLGVHFATRKREGSNAPFVLVGIAVGFVLGRVFANAGSTYFSNVLNWMQSASTVTLFGGLRSPGLVTRLTLWVALLGASIATAQGKHINVDVVMRFLTPRLRVPVAVLGWMVAATVCAVGVWGFFDTIAIEHFKARITVPCAADPTKDCDVGAKDKLAHVGHEMKRDFFLLGRQMSLDTSTLPKVIGGAKYNEYMKASEWNPWLKGAAWTDYFAAEDVNGQLMDESQPDATRLPVINVPGSGEDTNGLLIRDLNLVFPFGLLMIALRFILRSLLAIGGVVKVDPDAQHGGEEAKHEAEAKDADPDAKEVAS
jgi:hypothetical protein